ncbi:MAG: MASE1 domain-containing protein, partial [Pseudolabrys sp.]|nr:MASE1 domain-containing protein [Pseudolabrys sp.]
MTSSPADRSNYWRATPRYLLELIGTGAAYFVLAKLGLQLASINPSATPVWPASGFAIGVLLLGGIRLAPAILAAAFAANFTTAGTLYSAAAIACGNTLEAIIGASLAAAWTGTRNVFTAPTAILKFTLVAGLATAISAGVGVATLDLAQMAPWDKLPTIGLTWWLGDLAGALVIAPLIVLWARSGGERISSHVVIDSLAGLIAAVAVGALAFSPLVDATTYRGPLAFLAILPLIWSALRLGPRDTATIAFALSAFAVWGTLMDGGPFARNTINDNFLMLVMFMITASVPSLVLSADVAQHKRTEEDLRRTQVEMDATIQTRTAALAMINAQLSDANVLLREAQRLADLGSFIWDLQTGRLTWSDQLFEIYGRSREDFKGTAESFLEAL